MCLRVLLAVVCASLGLFAALVLAIALWRAERSCALPVRDKRIVTKGGGNH